MTLALAIYPQPGAAAAEKLSFSRDVRPILSDRCFHCHGPDATNQDSDFRLDTRDHAVADLGGYFGVVPGDVLASELHARIHADDWSQMPPADSNRVLSQAEKDILDRWIEEGAGYEDHWAFEALPKSISVPEAGRLWARNPVDRFVYRKIADAGVGPNREMSRSKWLRRVTFDLTGLPPTLDELDDFNADQSVGAFERAVDRLLSTDACAERLTSEWLDVARYSDSYGYQRDDERFVWPYRDWVIDAFRRNMPYDRFVTWQIAGDLLPDAGEEQKLATAFNRLHSHKKEGGVAVEEFRVEYMADRVHTFGTAFMGITLECTRCHDHKYDPVTMRDYYSLGAFFQNIDERGLISYFTDATPTPSMPLPSAAQKTRLADAADDVAAAERAYSNSVESAGSAFRDWHATEGTGRAPQIVPSTPVAALDFETFGPVTTDEAFEEKHKYDGSRIPKPADSMRSFANPYGQRALTTPANTLVDGPSGKAVRLSGDDAVVLPGVGHYGRHDRFTISLWLRAEEVADRSVIYRRSRGWDDAGSIGYELTLEEGRLSAKMVHFWPGDALCVETVGTLEPDRWTHVTVTYEGSSTAAGFKIYRDGRPAETAVVRDNLTRTITDWRLGYEDLAIGARFRDRGFKNGAVDEFRVFDRALTAGEVAAVFAESDGSALSAVDEQDLFEHFLATLYEPSITAADALTDARRRYNEIYDEVPAIAVMRETEEPKPAYILARGAYDQPTTEVTADTPEFLPAFPADAPRNRLGLARWLTDPDHPLFARVTVNRYWQMLFGRGLVPTSEDFGYQSTPPTHPDLLDWLARDFVDHGYDVKRLLRGMVLSATYRQSADVGTVARDRDPENILLARGSGSRLSAEMIRDSALAVSGLLVGRVGGPPVKPYDLKHGYTPLNVDEGEKLYRRSLYTFWKRTSPAPVMVTMNAVKREVCRVRRETTQSPLQALVLLNGPQFVESGRVYAADLVDRFGPDIDAIAFEVFRRFTSREPSAAELQILTRLVEEQALRFRDDPSSARAILTVGNAAEADIRDRAMTAAVAVLVSSVMNLHESLRTQ